MPNQAFGAFLQSPAVAKLLAAPATSSTSAAIGAGTAQPSIRQSQSRHAGRTVAGLPYPGQPAPGQAGPLPSGQLPGIRLAASASAPDMSGRYVAQDLIR